VYLAKFEAILGDAGQQNTRPRPIEEKCGGGLKHVLPQFVPCIPFGEYALRKALGAVTTIRFLDNLEHQFQHMSILRQCLEDLPNRSEADDGWFRAKPLR